MAVNPGAAIRAERVATRQGDPAPERFAHFHDAAELVWFTAVAGRLECEDGNFELRGGTLAYLPPMRRHDFAIPAGAHHWVLVHLDPFLATRLGHDDGAERCRVVSFSGIARDRVGSLFDWLVEATAEPAPGGITSGIAALILQSLALGSEESPAAKTMASGAIDRLRPALDRIARSPADPLSLTHAASLCHMSPAYFSRRFKQVFGSNFTDYLRAWRLRLAAQRLLCGGERINVIARETGFASPAHMTDQFRRCFGLTPRAYRAGGGKGANPR